MCEGHHFWYGHAGCMMRLMRPPGPWCVRAPRWVWSSADGKWWFPKDDVPTASRGIDMLAFWGVYIHNVVSLGKEMICLELDLFIQCFVAPFFCRRIRSFLSANGFQKRQILDWHWPDSLSSTATDLTWTQYFLLTAWCFEHAYTDS